MGLFRRKPSGGPEQRAATLAQLQKILDRSGLTNAGVVVVDEDQALRSSAAWSSVELIAGVGSTMPLDEYRLVGGEQIEVPLSLVFADPDPDPSVTAQGFRAQVLRSAACRGNAYAFVLVDNAGSPIGLSAIHPDRVTWRYELAGGACQWQVYVDNAVEYRWPLGRLWHFAVFQPPGYPMGRNPIEAHRQTIGAAIAAQQFGANFFGDGGAPRWIIKVPEEPSVDEAKALKDKVMEATKGGAPAILPAELTFEKLTIPPEDSQFLETQRFGVEEVARIFLGGFPELIGGSVSGGSLTYANREQRMADFIALSLSPRYLIPLEAALSTLVPRGRYVKHNLDALLRADLVARFQAYELSAKVSDLMGMPLRTVDEMRRLENLPPLTEEQIASFLRRPMPTPTTTAP